VDEAPPVVQRSCPDQPSRGERGKGAEEAWPPPQRGHRAAGGSSGREANGPRSRRPATLGGREGVIKCGVWEKKDCRVHPLTCWARCHVIENHYQNQQETKNRWFG
jgi:hypothetical protein